jgi:hypothetical protein
MGDKSLKKGQRVSWNSPQGRVTGSVVKKQTTATRIKGHLVAASKTQLQYIVESKKTGARAAHAPRTLKKER